MRPLWTLLDFFVQSPSIWCVFALVAGFSGTITGLVPGWLRRPIWAFVCVLLGVLALAGRYAFIEEVALGLAIAGGLAVPRVARVPAVALALAAALLVPQTRDAGTYQHAEGLPIVDAVSVEVLQRGFAIATGVEVAPDGRVFVAEHGTGRIDNLVERDGVWTREPFAVVPLPDLEALDFWAVEAGLWGIEHHPTEPWLYAMAIDRFEAGGGLAARQVPRGFSRVVRIRTQGEPVLETILADLPAAPVHNGGALAFGPDGMLYVTIGDANGPPEAMADPTDLRGTVLRVRPDGSIPDGNPHGAVFAWNFRNPYGLTFVGEQLWLTENGAECCDRLLRWEGDHAEVLFDSGRSRPGPTGLVLVPPHAPYASTGDLLFGTWHTMTLHRVRPEDPRVHQVVLPRNRQVKGQDRRSEFGGGITGLSVAPDGVVWFSTLDAVGRITRLDPP